MNRIAKIALATPMALSCMCMSQAYGATITAASTNTVTDGSTVSAVSWVMRIGTPNGTTTCAIIPFLLPTLPAGTTFTTADFQDELNYKTNVTAYNLDLYGLMRAASTADVLVSDFYAGSYDAAARLIQNDLVTANSSTANSNSPGAGPWITTDNSGDSALVNFLNEMYADGANAGKYIFLRVSPDIATATANSRYELTSSTAGNTAQKPVITYTTGAVPEPASCAILAIGGISLLLHKRRK